MSFIDYNFFPILFFLGWNILTTKQFRPSTSNTSNPKITSVLSTNTDYDSTGFYSKKKPIRLINQKILQNDIIDEKSNIIEFISKFRFYNEKPKSKKKSPENAFLSNEIIFPPNRLPPLKLFKENRKNISREIPARTEMWLPNQRYYFTNSNFINNNWKINFTSNLFDLTYIPKTKFLSSFFPYHYKIKHASPSIESSLNLMLNCQKLVKNVPLNANLSRFSNLVDDHVFFGKICDSQIFWKKIQKQLSYTRFFNKIFPPSKSSGEMKKVIKNTNSDNYNSTFPNSSFLTILVKKEKLNNINFIQKRRSKIRFLLRIPIQKTISLNKFQIALYFSKISQSGPGQKIHHIFDENLIKKNCYIEADSDRRGGDLFGEESRNAPSALDEGSFSANSSPNKSPLQRSEWPDMFPFKWEHIRAPVFPIIGNTNASLENREAYSSHTDRREEWPPSSVFNSTSHRKYRDVSKNKEADYSLYQGGESQSFRKHFFLQLSEFYQNSNLLIYGGSWYYENLTFPYKLSAKLQGKLESDIGIYSLAHKLSSVGFMNGNSEIDIYPFKYNDSYRYNFQNMNLSNYRFLSPLNFSPTRINGDKNFRSFGDFQKFLDFQNPTFSKIYAPLFQPQNPAGTDLLSFLYNSFLNIIPNSTLDNNLKYSKKRHCVDKKRWSVPADDIKGRWSQTIPIMNESRQFSTNKSVLAFKRLHPELGQHANSYPWITQNASDRWSNFLKFSISPERGLNTSRLSDFSGIPLLRSSLNPQINTSSHQLPFLRQLVPIIHFNDGIEKSPINLLETSKDSTSYFIEKPSYIKKPSIFFSSFRHLPYFFMSETLSTKNLVFPQTNLSLFPCFSVSIASQKSLKNNAYMDLSIPEYSFFNNVSEPNKNRVIKPWKGYLQHKSFSLKPLSMFIQKSIGYETRLFFRAVPHVGWPNSKTQNSEKFYPLQKDTNLIPIQKNTWKIFPPLFQPFTFRFIDLNLPRTWSSELLSCTLNNTLKPSGLEVSKLKSLQERKKQFVPREILSETPKWNMTQKKFFRFPIPFYFSDFFPLQEKNENNEFGTKSTLLTNDSKNNKNLGFYESAFPLSDFSSPFQGNFSSTNKYKEIWNNNHLSSGFEKKKPRINFNETLKSPSKIMVYGEKPLLKNRTIHGPPLKNQRESISLPSYLKNITNQNYQNLCPNNLNEFYFVFWILFNKTLFIYLSLYYLRKFISFLGVRFVIT